MILAIALAVGCSSPAGEALPEGTPGPPEIVPPATSWSGTNGVVGVTASLGEIGSVVVVRWTQSAQAEVHLEYAFDDGIWLASPTRSLGAGTWEDLLLGVPFDEEVTWRLVVDDGVTLVTSPDATIATAALPAAWLAGRVTLSDPERYDAVGAPWLLVGLSEPEEFSDPWYNVIIDRQGRVVWALRSPQHRVAMHGRVARDGRSLLLDRNSYWAVFDGGDGSTIDRVDLTGAVLHTYQVPGLHHPFVDLPGERIAWGATVGGYANEYLRVVDTVGAVETIFDCAAWMADIGQDGYCMSNTLSYHEATNKLLFSQFSTDTILQIDRTTGAVDRWFGHLDGSWSFDPPESAFWWQHGGVITSTGTLLTSSDLTESGVETVVREYAIDEAAQTLREVWSFGVGDGVYGVQMGEVERLPNGNTLHNYGELAMLREATIARDVVWQIAWDSYAVGRSMPVVDLYALAPGPED